MISRRRSPATRRLPAVASCIVVASALACAPGPRGRSEAGDRGTGDTAALASGSSTPPTIDVPAELVVAAAGPFGAPAFYSVHAAGAVGDCQGTGTSSCPAWKPASSGVSCGSVKGLTVDPSDPTVLYGISEYVFKSVDRGMTWRAASYQIAPSSLAVTPAGAIYAAGSVGIFESVDGGATWGFLRAGDFSSSQIVADPTVSGTLYVTGASPAVLKSTDGGRPGPTRARACQRGTSKPSPSTSTRRRPSTLLTGTARSSRPSTRARAGSRSTTPPDTAPPSSLCLRWTGRRS